MLRIYSRLRIPSSLGVQFSSNPFRNDPVVVPEANKSVLQKDFEEKEKWVQEEEPEVKKLSARELKVEQDKNNLKWRKSFDNNDQVWKSKFGAFISNENDMSLLEMMQQPWDLSPKNIKRAYAEHVIKKEAYEQGFIEQRNKMLGPDLAIAHFITYRNGKIRFQGSKEWKTKVDNDNLPRRFDPNYFVDAINFDGNNLHYEGVENFRDLFHCKSISLRNCKFFDDWCLDRLSGLAIPCLEELDIAGTDVTIRGFGVFYRFPALKRLIIDKEKKNSIEWQLVFATLEENNLNLQVLDSKDFSQT